MSNESKDDEKSESSSEMKIKHREEPVRSQNLYQDQEEVGQTQSEPDPNVVMDHVQLARRVQRQPPMRTQNFEGEKREGDKDVDAEVDVIGKPDSESAPTGVSYS